MSPSPVPPERRAHRAVRSPRRRPRARGSRSREWVRVRQGAVVAVSAAVLVSTGVAWATLRDLSAGLSTSNALAGGSASRDGSVNILLMGLDSRKDQNGNALPPSILDQLHAGDGNEGGYNTNTLILMHIPSNGGRVSAFSIPRDDYVPVRDIPGNDHVKIKEAYGLKKAVTEDALAKQGVIDRQALETAGREAGRKETVQTVRDFLGVPIDHFAEVNLAGFYDMASALGGVQVCVNHPVNDSYSGADFPAGRQTLNGAQSLAFVRQRHGLPNGDLDRTHRQQAFLASVTHKLTSAGTFTNIAQLQALLEVAKRDVVISAGWDISMFIQQATNLTGGNVQFATLPVVRFDTVDGQAVNIVDVPTVQREVQVAFGLQPKQTTNPAAVIPTPSPAVPATVDVLNGDGTPGLATTVSRALTGGGLTAGVTGNSTQHSTAVTYGSGAHAQADTIATLLDTPPATADAAMPAGRISVILGTGFTPAPGLAQRAATLKNAGTPPAEAVLTGAAAAPAPPGGLQGLPMDGSGIPCVD